MGCPLPSPGFRLSLGQMRQSCETSSEESFDFFLQTGITLARIRILEMLSNLRMPALQLPNADHVCHFTQ